MRIVDFHNHYYPPEYVEALKRPASPSSVRVTYDQNGNPCVHYPGDYNILVPGHRDIDYRQRVLDEHGVDTQVLSFTTPGVHVETPALAVEWARMVNNAFARVVRERRGRFTSLATLPLNDPAASVIELERAMTELGMAKVPQSIALGHSVDETSVKATWHVPRAHYLESWGDARAVGGTLSVVQPLILPLFGGRTPVEVLGLMVAGKDRPGYDIVRETWNPILGERDFDTKWNRVLHDGFLSGSELPEVVPSLTAKPLAELASLVGGAGTTRAEAGSPGGLEIVFLPSPSLHDGRFANDGWLQELPDPLTKLTWDNPALVSPKTAETLGLASEDVVRIDHSGRALELPVSILPGMCTASSGTARSMPSRPRSASRRRSSP